MRDIIGLALVIAGTKIMRGETLVKLIDKINSALEDDQRSEMKVEQHHWPCPAELDPREKCRCEVNRG